VSGGGQGTDSLWPDQPGIGGASIRVAEGLTARSDTISQCLAVVKISKHLPGRRVCVGLKFLSAIVLLEEWPLV
jgi:hypothetical protein